MFCLVYDLEWLLWNWVFVEGCLDEIYVWSVVLWLVLGLMG